MPVEANPGELDVLYRDAALLIVNKPSGMVVHRGWATDRITALSRARQIAGQWVYPVHRLDRSTSGVLVFALTAEIAGRVQESFAAELVQKRYLALVRGVAPARALIDHAIAKEKDKPKLPARTRMACLASYLIWDDLACATRSYSWVEAQPLTGRPHQIRRHLKHLNHPIIGDVRYGKAEHNRLFRSRFALQRMALHAETFSLPHPVDGTPLHVTAPIPSDLLQVLTALGAAQAEATRRETFARAHGGAVDGGMATGRSAAQAATKLELAPKT
jgi:tRNA pseudouridine65 synthase